MGHFEGGGGAFLHQLCGKVVLIYVAETICCGRPNIAHN